MVFNERDIALALNGHTRQLWAEKHLEMSPSDDEKAWNEWYDFLHDRVEQSLKITLMDASDLTPRNSQEPFTREYQSRLKTELARPRDVIGAHYVCGNAAVRVPLSCLKSGTSELQI